MDVCKHLVRVSPVGNWGGLGGLQSLPMRGVLVVMQLPALCALLAVHPPKAVAQFRHHRQLQPQKTDRCM